MRAARIAAPASLHQRVALLMALAGRQPPLAHWCRYRARRLLQQQLVRNPDDHRAIYLLGELCWLEGQRRRGRALMRAGQGQAVP
ncbi:hypothetical protein A11A3_12278 [Alcanivorax hongdengensis A-11-3]|uniref:Uncharacterized protein n=1 Tax=Alcanivorax hongdengensis A-11-3 TaxID=1177179 RepID=L0WD93_9GAMM|nr:hypothetical protein [Alcanivorax hongdengensis]EKF73740.1 hypothetical protein A11A3_12278 [Alcanivorax hongdengensis A-11-3]